MRIALQQVRFAYRIEPIIDRLDWQIEGGQNWWLTGANGCGKSTLVDLLLQRQMPGQGQVQYQAFDPERDALEVSYRRWQTLVDQDNRFDDSEVRADACDPGTRLRTLILQQQPAGEDFQRITDALGLSDLLDRGLRFVSTGQGRKALLAQALLHRPKLLVLDAPAEGLDQQAQRQLPALLAPLYADPDVTVILMQSQAHCPAGIGHILELAQGKARFCGPQQAWQPEARHWQPGPLPPLQPTADLGDVPLIELAGVSVQFGAQAVLNDLHGSITPFQHTQLIGPNGSGKTTLLELISGYSHKAYGQPLSIRGQRRGSGESVWQVRQLFGLVNQHLHSQSPRREGVIDLVCSGFFDSLGLNQPASRQQQQSALQWLQAIGIDVTPKLRFDQLSFGQQRLVLLARAMVKQPAVLILDEPTVGLDSEHQQRLHTLLQAIAAQRHTTLLYVNHQVESALDWIVQRWTLEPAADGSRLRVEAC